MRSSISRRRFIGAGIASLGLGIRSVFGGKPETPRISGGMFPGKGIIVWHPEVTSGHSADTAAVQTMVDRGLCELTGQVDPVVALESLMPGIDENSKIAMKINCIASPSHCWTRWVIAQAVVNRLVQMLGGTFSPGNIAIFDKDDIEAHGYSSDRFPGVELSSSNQCDSGVLIPTPGRESELSRFIADADYLINMPVVKNHNANEFTLGMKNHYGSISPSTWCGNYDALLEINASPGIRDKTSLVILDALFGTYVSGLDGGPDNWTLHPGGTPNRICMGTDICVSEHLGQQMINEQRTALGIPVLTDYYLHRAGVSPYNLGIIEPAEMDISFIDASVVDALDAPILPYAPVLSGASPNPFSRKTVWKLSVKRDTSISARIVDISGHTIRTIAKTDFSPGVYPIQWDGTSDSGKRVPTGCYILSVGTDTSTLAGIVTLVR